MTRNIDGEKRLKLVRAFINLTKSEGVEGIERLRKGFDIIVAISKGQIDLMRARSCIKKNDCQAMN